MGSNPIRATFVMSHAIGDICVAPYATRSLALTPAIDDLLPLVAKFLPEPTAQPASSAAPEAAPESASSPLVDPGPLPA